MTHPRTPIHQALTGALLLLFAASPVVAQEAAGDPAEVASDQYTVLFENDAVRVLETNYEPGASSERHTHPDHVAVMMNEGTWRMVPPEGEPVEFVSARGEAVWADAGTHAMEYTGEEAGTAILVELKQGGDEPMMEGMADEAEAAAGAEAPADPVEVAGAQYSVLLDNAAVRVLQVSYAPGAESAMHGHPGLVVVALTDATWAGTTPDGEATEASMTAGQVEWNDASVHAMRNASDSVAEVILVEIKGH